MPGPNLPHELYNHCQVEIGGNVIIAGGRQGDDASDKTFILDENEWKEVKHMKVPRQFHSCAKLSDKLYSVGGKTGTYELLDSVEVYNPLSDIWTDGPKLPAKIGTAQLINFQNCIYLL